MKDIKIRFKAKVKVNKSGCHEWIGALDKFNYGRINVGGKNRTAHSVAYEIYSGETKGLHVCHSCDNPKCVNPKHLFLGTPKDNMNDMFKKERSNRAKGEKCWTAKLTTTDILIIRKSTLPQVMLAETFGVTKDTIHKVKKYKTWKHVT